MAMEAVERNWADLPPDLLHLITKKLPDISDFIRSRAICKPWRFHLCLDLAPQFPWILKLCEGPHLEFYSIASNKVYTIHAPKFSDKELFGPRCGFMLARQSGISNRNHFSLLNPLNHSEVSLPVLHRSELNVSWIGPQSFRPDDYVVILDYPSRLFTCKVGDEKWDCIDREWWSRYFYLKNLIFMVDGYCTKVIDIEGRKETYVIPPPKLYKFSGLNPYLVESCGEILRVFFSYSYNMAEYESFEIHRLEFGNGEGHPCWVEVSSIGDQILFFDFSAGRGFSLRANDFAGFRGNCIYFINKGWQAKAKSPGMVYMMKMYDIENGNTVLIDCPFDCKNAVTWFMPTLDHI